MTRISRPIKEFTHFLLGTVLKLGPPSVSEKLAIGYQEHTHSISCIGPRTTFASHIPVPRLHQTIDLMQKMRTPALEPPVFGFEKSDNEGEVSENEQRRPISPL